MRNGTRINAVMADIQAKISSRVYLPGNKIPSVRAQAKIMEVSISTVVEAYERLMAEGIIISKQGAGYYVTGPIAPLALTRIQPITEREIDPLWISRQALETDNSSLKPGCGWLPETWLYETGVRRALRLLARAKTSELVDYATPLGHFPLRQLIARRLVNNGMNVSPDQIMLTESGTHSIDLICRFLLQPGDVVLVDDPCYFNFHALLKAHHIKIIGVPYTPHGPDLKFFESLVEEYNPRLYITNSGIHNPTGAVLSPAIAHKLLKIIDDTNLMVIEDDIFADFESKPAQRLFSFDDLSKVIQIGSFSKTISASLRCGYIVFQKEWIENLADLKIATSFGGGRFAAELIFTILTDSGYRRHMEHVRSRLSDEMFRIIPKLRDIGIEPWLVPQSGMFLWCSLPKNMDARIVAKACLKHGVILAPGNAFSQSLNFRNYLRFNVSQCSDESLFQILKEILSEQSKINSI